MRVIRWLPIVLIGAMAATQAQAVTEADFGVRTTGELVSLCSADPKDPLAVAAVNFCQGFVVGSVRLQQTYQTASSRQAFFCLPEPPPNRDQGIAAFVTWAKADSTRLAMKPLDAMFAYLGGQYPCKRGK